MSDLDLYRIRFKDGIKAADSRLVWADSTENAESLGRDWCEPQGFRLIGAERETVARQGEPVTPPANKDGFIAPSTKPDDGKKLVGAAVAAAAMVGKK